MRRPALVAALIAVPLFACSDHGPTSPNLVPTAALSTVPVFDGAHNGGNPHFFFLPPLVKNPKASGTFNPDLLPVVEVCALTGGGLCADPQPQGFPLQFTMEGSGPAAIRLNESSEQYHVNFQTGGYALDPAVHYRIRVFAVEGGAELGHIDIDVIARGGGGGNGGSSDLVTVRQGSTLPIRFRIEQGIACTDTDDCMEAVVGSEGGTFTTPTGFAGIDVPAGALDGPVLISIERVNVAVEPCLPSDLIQAEGCYRFETDPELSEVQEGGLNEFHDFVTAAACLDPAVLALPEHHQYALHAFDFDQPALGVRLLPSAPADFLFCNGFEPLALHDDGALLRFARAGWERLEPLVRLLGPARAHAVNLGFGGLTKSFSNIGWARALEFEVLAGDDQSGPAGSTLEVDPAVRVTATHWDPEEFESAPVVEGIEVTFTFTDPAGNVTTLLDTTNADGIASVPWVLGEGPGENTLEISGVTSGPAEMHATAVTDPLTLESLAAGGTFTCGLDEARHAYCWGANPGGVLGNGSLEPSTRPVAVGDDEFPIQFETLTVGEAHACGISVQGATYCWGSNANGQLGLGDFTPRSLPEPVPGHTFQQISAGLTTTCAIDVESQVYCWGSNVLGALGTDTDGADSNVPLLAASGMQFQAISTSFFHTCGIALDARAYCWGSEQLLGSPIEEEISFDPDPVDGELSFAQIDAGIHTTCGVTVASEAYCWGRNETGAAGNGSFDFPWTPLPVALEGSVQLIDMQHHNTILQFGCALVGDIAHCWGSNQAGQLGIGDAELDECAFSELTFSCTPQPQQVEGRWQTLSLGREHVCAISEDGALFCWGNNSSGQFGDGTTESSSVPRKITLAHP